MKNKLTILILLIALFTTLACVSTKPQPVKTEPPKPTPEPISIKIANATFEEPDTSKQTNFKDVPGWESLGEVKDSGVEKGYAASGSWACYLMAGDAAMVSNGIDAKLEAGLMYQMEVSARSTYQGRALQMTFYVDVAGNKVPLLSKTYNIGDSYQVFTLVLNAAEYANFVNNPLTIGFQNVTLLWPEHSWIGIDNVRLSIVGANPWEADILAKVKARKGNPVEIANPGFEEPNAGKQTGFAKVNGWDSIKPVTNSGVEEPAAHTGKWGAYLKAGDGPIFSTSIKKMIDPSEIYKLTIWAKALNQGKGIRMAIFTILGDQPVILASRTISVAGWNEYSIYFSSMEFPVAIGKPISIAFENVVLGTPNDESWSAIDDVTLTVYK